MAELRSNTTVDFVALFDSQIKHFKKQLQTHKKNLFKTYTPIPGIKRPLRQFPKPTLEGVPEKLSVEGVTKEWLARWGKENGQHLVLGTDNVMPYTPAEYLGMKAIKHDTLTDPSAFYYSPGVSENLVGYMLAGMTEAGLASVYSGPSVHMLDIADVMKMTSTFQIPIIVLAGGGGGLQMAGWGAGHHNLNLEAYRFPHSSVFQPSNAWSLKLILEHLDRNESEGRPSFVNIPYTQLSVLPEALSKDSFEKQEQIFKDGFYLASHHLPSETKGFQAGSVVIIATGQAVAESQVAASILKSLDIPHLVVDVFNLSSINNDRLAGCLTQLKQRYDKKPSAIVLFSDNNQDIFRPLREAIPPGFKNSVITLDCDTHLNDYLDPKRRFWMDASGVLRVALEAVLKKDVVKKRDCKTATQRQAYQAEKYISRSIEQRMKLDESLRKKYAEKPILDQEKFSSLSEAAQEWAYLISIVSPAEQAKTYELAKESLKIYRDYFLEKMAEQTVKMEPSILDLLLA